MQYQISMHELPEELEISDVLTPDELEKKITRNIRLKITKPSEGGGAFHEKSDKNKKVNNKVRHVVLMRIKYGKPKRRKPKQ